MRHPLPRRPRAAVLHRLGNRRHGQPQSLHRQGLGDRLGLPRDVAFDELRDRVHAAGRGHFRRHADRKLRIDQGDPRQDAVVAKTLLEGRIVRRNDRVAGRFGARPGRGGHGQHGQRRIDDLQPPADIFQIVGHRGALPIRGDDGRGLGQVDGRPAADGQEKTAPVGGVAAKFPGHAIDVLHLGLVEDRLDERRLDVLRGKQLADFAQHVGGHGGRQAGKDHRPAAERAAERAHLAAAAPAEDDFRRCDEIIGNGLVHDAKFPADDQQPSL